MKEILTSEWERMWGRKKTQIGLGFFMVYVFFMCLFLHGFGISFYSPEQSVRLNALNFPPFLLKEVSFAILLVFLPMFVVDSLNGEYQSGAYRMVLLRPQSRLKLLLAKWLMQVLVLGSMILFTFVLGWIWGHLFLPDLKTTSFLGTEALDGIGAFLYSLTFYGLTFFIMLGVLAIGSFISIVMPNMILSFAGWLAFLIGSVYVWGKMVFLLFSSSTLFNLLGRGTDMYVYPVTICLLVVGMVASGLVWWRKDLFA